MRQERKNKRIQGLTEKANEEREGIDNAIDSVSNPLLKFANSAKNSPRRVVGAVAIGATFFVLGFLASQGDKIENKLPVAGGTGVAGTAAALAILPRSKIEQRSIAREDESLEFAEKRSRYKQFLEDNQQAIERIKTEIEWAKENNLESVDLLSQKYRNLLQEQEEIRDSYNNPQSSRQSSTEATPKSSQLALEGSDAEPINIEHGRRQPQPEPVELEQELPDDEDIT